MIADRLLNIYKTPITTLNISSRATNALLRSGIEYIEQLIKVDHAKLLQLRNMGTKTANEVINKVKSLGFDWSPIPKKDFPG